MIRATSFAIHLTYTCPLTCKHCCFSSSPTVKDRLSPEQIFGLIDSLEGKNIDLLAFTGGEPFLFGTKLVDFVKRGKSVAKAVRIVTSAYWANSDEATAKRLLPLVAAGLDELSISWDDYHEEFVDFENVRRAFSFAKSHGILAAISLVQSPVSHWSAERVRNNLGEIVEAGDVVVEAQLNYTGRAEKELAGSGVWEGQHLGPCPYVMTGPTASAKGKLLACCGVIPETDDLVLSDDLAPDSVWKAIELGSQSALMSWIHLRGPYSIMEHISKKHNIPIPAPDEIGGNCEACKLLFKTPAIHDKLKESVIEMSEKIGAESAVLEALGLLDVRGLAALWSEGVKTKETKNV